MSTLNDKTNKSSDIRKQPFDIQKKPSHKKKPPKRNKPYGLKTYAQFQVSTSKQFFYKARGLLCRLLTIFSMSYRCVLIYIVFVRRANPERVSFVAFLVLSDCFTLVSFVGEITSLLFHFLFTRKRDVSSLVDIFTPTSAKKASPSLTDNTWAGSSLEFFAAARFGRNCFCTILFVCFFVSVPSLLALSHQCRLV